MASCLLGPAPASNFFFFFLTSACFELGATSNVQQLHAVPGAGGSSIVSFGYVGWEARLKYGFKM
jgi:hypothetical protein